MRGNLPEESHPAGQDPTAPRKIGLFRLVWPVFLLAVGYAWFYTCENQWFNSMIQNVVLWDLPDRAFYVAFMGSCSAIFGLVFYLLFGAISDAKDPSTPPRGKRRMFVIGAIIAGFAMVLVPFQRDYWMVWFLDVVIIGIAANAGLIARDAVIPDIVEEERRGRANGVIGIGEALGTVIVFAFTTLLILGYPNLGTETTSDPNGPIRHVLIIVPAGVFIIVVGCLYYAFIREQKTRSENWEPQDWKQILRRNFNKEEMLKPENRPFLKFFGIRLLVTIGDKIYVPYLIIFITAEAGRFVTPDAIVALIIIFGLATLIGLTVIPRFIDKRGRKRTTIPAAAATGGGFIFFSLFLSYSIVVASIGLFFGVLGSQAFVIATRTWSQDLLPEDKRGNFLGILNITNTITQIPGLYIGAAVLTYWGMEWIFLVAGLFYAVLFPLFLLVPDAYQENLEIHKNINL